MMLVTRQLVEQVYRAVERGLSRPREICREEHLEEHVVLDVIRRLAIQGYVHAVTHRRSDGVREPVVHVERPLAIADFVLPSASK